MSISYIFILTFTVTAMLASCAVNFGKTKVNIVALTVIINISDCLAYILSGSMTGLADSGVDLLKNVAFSKFNSNKATVIFSILRLIVLCLFYENILSIIFIILEIVGTYLVIRGTAQQYRLCNLVCQIFWVVYDYVMISPLVALISSIVIVFMFIAIIKYKDNEEVV